MGVNRTGSALTDDSGSGADGTVVNSAWLVQLLDDIDVALATVHDVFLMKEAQATSTTAATGTRNNHDTLLFDKDADEDAVFASVLGNGYDGDGLSVDIYFTAPTLTINDVVWNAAIERMNIDLDSDDFSAANAATGTVNGTSGIITKITIVFTDGSDMKSLAKGEAYRIKITRDADNGSDTLDEDAELHRVVVRET